MKRPHIGLATLIVSACLSSTGPALAREDRARQLLGVVADRYKRMDAYADRGELFVKIRADGKVVERSRAVPLEFLRPNRLVMDAGVVALIGDDQALRIINFARRRAFTQPPTREFTVDPARLDEEQREQNGILLGARRLYEGASDPDLALGVVGGQAVNLLLTLLLEDDAAERLL
jgi:hypothetical protein